MLEEQALLEKEVYRLLTTTPDEKELVQISKRIDVLKKLLNLSLTPEEFRDYTKEKEGFDIRRITGFINARIKDLEDFYEDVVFLESGYEETIAKCEAFYSLTYRRDAHFVEKIKETMDAQNQTQAALIAGGYHSPNLKFLLRREGISYATITPQIDHETNQKRYEKLLLSQNLKKAFTAENRFAFQASHLPLVAATQMPTRLVTSDPWGNRQAFVNALDRRTGMAVVGSRFSGVEQMAKQLLVPSDERDLMSLISRIKSMDPDSLSRLTKEVFLGLDLGRQNSGAVRSENSQRVSISFSPDLVVIGPTGVIDLSVLFKKQGQKYSVKSFQADDGAGGGILRMVKNLGGLKSLAIRQKGSSGSVGRAYRRMIENERGVDHRILYVPGRTKVSLFVHLPGEHGSATREFLFQPQNPRLTGQETEEMIHAIKNLPRPGKGVFAVLEGHVFPGLESSGYFGEAVQALKERGYRIFVDFLPYLSRDEMMQIVSSSPEVVKMNGTEFSKFTGRSLPKVLGDADISRIGHLAMAISKKHKIQVVIVSLGSKGAVLVAHHRVFYANAPSVLVKSTLCCGDALAGAFIHSLIMDSRNDRDPDYERAIQRAVAAGTATATFPFSTVADRNSLDRLASQVKVRPIQGIRFSSETSGDDDISYLTGLLAKKEYDTTRHVKDIQALVVFGIADKELFKEIIRLMDQGTYFKYLVISGGKGHAYQAIAAIARERGLVIDDKQTEAMLIHAILLDTAKKSALREKARIVKILERKSGTNVVVLEDESQHTLDNIRKLKALMNREHWREHWLETQGKFYLMFMTTPLQMLRTDAQLRKVFRDEIKSGQIEPIAHTRLLDLGEENIAQIEEIIFKELIRLVSNAQTGDLDLPLADEVWPRAERAFEASSKKETIRNWSTGYLKGMGITKEALIQNAPKASRAFLSEALSLVGLKDYLEYYQGKLEKIENEINVNEYLRKRPDLPIQDLAAVDKIIEYLKQERDSVKQKLASSGLRSAKESLIRPFVIRTQDFAEGGAVLIAKEIAAIQKSGRSVVNVVLPSGGTIEPIYQKLSVELVEKATRGEINLDQINWWQAYDYKDLTPDHMKSTAHSLRFLENLEGVSREQVHFISDSPTPQDYWEKLESMGGIDIAVAVPGQNGHFWMVDPNTSEDLTVGEVCLTKETVQKNGAGNLANPAGDVIGVTLGPRAILSARSVFLFANTKGKQAIIGKFWDSAPTPDIPVTLLKKLENAPDRLKVVVDIQAAPPVLVEAAHPASRFIAEMAANLGAENFSIETGVLKYGETLPFNLREGLLLLDHLRGYLIFERTGDDEMNQVTLFGSPSQPLSTPYAFSGPYTGERVHIESLDATGRIEVRNVFPGQPRKYWFVKHVQGLRHAQRSVSEDRETFLFALQVFKAKGEGYFAVSGKSQGAPDILGVEFDEKTRAVTVHFNDEKSVTLKNYTAVLRRNRVSGRLESGSVRVSKSELMLSDIQFELGKQTSGVEASSKGWITNAPKVLEIRLSGFMNEETHRTDGLFTDWLICAAHKAGSRNAVLVLEGASAEQRQQISNRASVLFPRGSRFIYDASEALPLSHQHASRVALVAIDPERIPSLEKGRLYLVAGALERNTMHNVTALIQTALVEAEVGLEGMRPHDPKFARLRDVYEASGIKIGGDIPGFIEFTKGAITRDRLKRWGLVPYRVDAILRAYELGNRMASQAA
ncbi:MAG: 6-phosphogluconolactonase [Candidatus Omnitrophica bacterium]|nr:6-phosphogluconolactonase [Candidatus Omnitrophota bacterium]